MDRKEGGFEGRLQCMIPLDKCTDAIEFGCITLSSSDV